MNTYLSIIILNVNRRNAPIKRHRVADGIKKQEPIICCLQETHLRAKDTYRLKVRGWEKTFHVNGKDRKAGVAMLILDKIDFKMKAIEIISSIFSDHNGMKLDINHRKRNEKKTDNMETKKRATRKTSGLMRKSRWKLKNTSRQMIMKTQPLKIYGMPQKQCSEGNS